MKKIKPYTVGRNVWFILSIISLLFSFNISVADSIDQVRIHRSPEKTRVVFDLAGPVTHRLFSLEDPKRLVIDIDEVTFEVDLKEVRLSNTPIAQIRTGKRNTSDLRVVFDLGEVVNPKSFSLEPIMQYGDRLVVDLYTEKQPATTSLAVTRFQKV